MSEELESAPVVPTKKERKHLRLREELDNIHQVTESWIKLVVQLAKESKVLYFNFNKILARVLKAKKIEVVGYHQHLKQAWYPAA